MSHSALPLQKFQDTPHSYLVQQLEVSEQCSKTSWVFGKLGQQLHVTIGAFAITGAVDTKSLDCVLEITVCGLDLGLFFGSLQQAFEINLALQFVKGMIKLELDAFDEIRLSIETNPTETGKWFVGLEQKESILAMKLPSIVCEPWDSVQHRLSE